jgi:hypothetical protein
MSESATSQATIRIEIVCAWPDRVWQQRLSLPVGTTVEQALSASDWHHLQTEIGESPKVGVFGRLVSGAERLNDGDRIELYRPLLADPKDARRKRAAGGG